MKAIVLKEPGGIDNLVISEVAPPQPKSDDVVIQVHAISINPVDVKTRKGGALYPSLKEQEPVILGWDVSGVVTAVGNAVQRFQKGDAVFGMVNFPGHGRAYAEFVAAPEAHLAQKPENSTHTEAAATTLAALTAWQVLVQEASVRAGQHVLVHAAAGGVGHFAVQLVRHFGAVVSGTASVVNLDFLKELGVHHPIDYTRKPFYEQVQDIDIVLDPIGGDTTVQSLQVLKPGGTLISIVGGVKQHVQALAEQKNIRAKNYLVHSSGTDMEQLAQLLKKGKLQPFVSHQFPFEEIKKAHEQIETSRTRGKIIVNVI